MIEGMEILKQTDIVEKVLPDFARAFLFIIFTIGIVASIGWTFYEEEFSRAIVGTLFTMLICVIVYAIFLVATKPTPTGRYEYEVVFDDSVNFNEVYKRFEIVETRENIYVLRDFEPVEGKCNCHNTHTCKKKVEREDASKIENNELNTDEVEDNNIPNYCSNCGESFADADKFCSECGTKR